MESGGADPVTLAGQIAAFDGVDLWGLSEVNGDDDALLYEAGAEVGEAGDFARVTGTTGGGDRLVALYDDDRSDLLGSSKLEAINVGGNVRASLVVTLTERSSGLQFLFLVNHLYRSDQDARHTQAILLNQWAATQSLPAIAVGDFTFDYAVDESSRDAGYDRMTANSRWRWVKPPTLVTTQCSGWPCAYHSVLDSVFVAGAAQAWPASAEIVVRAGDFPDDASTRDHRPVRATFILQLSPVDSLWLPSVVKPAGSTEPPVPYICGRDAYNCADFASQPEAQAAFDYCWSRAQATFMGSTATATALPARACRRDLPLCGNTLMLTEWSERQSLDINRRCRVRWTVWDVMGFWLLRDRGLHIPVAITVSHLYAARAL